VLHGATSHWNAASFKENHDMNKTDTIDHIARSADLSKEAAGRVMDAFEARLKAHTAEGKRVVFRGFGSFSRGLPAQKTGRNPRTGKPITYTAYHKPKSVPAVGEATLRNEIAADAQVSLAEAGRALAALRAAITTSMRKGGIVSFYGFGRFYVGRRSARSGRNPRTGASILIRAARVPRFRASKTGNTGGKFSAGEKLKAAVN
jgi:DNA-binding protein HU-beta